MSTVNLVLIPADLDIEPTWTVADFHQAFVESITSAVTSSNVILGQVGGTAPASPIGPWLNGTTLYAWNGSAYAPATIKVGTATYQVTLAGTPTVNRIINLPDKDGTLALTSDITHATVTPTLGPTVTIDWSAGDSFAIALDQNITIAHTNTVPGKEVSIAIYNPAAASWTVTWPAENLFESAAPTQSTDDKTDVHWVRNIGGTLYARYLQGYA